MLKDSFSNERNSKRKPPGGPAGKQPSPAGSKMSLDARASSLAELTLSRLGRADESTSLAEPAAAPAAQEQPKGAPCDLAGKVINEIYQIEALINQGGMGQVLLATHLKRNNIPVAFKLMLRDADPNSSAFFQFMNECKNADHLRHPNLVKVLDYGILLDSMRPYLVMEFIEGPSLRELIRQNGPMPEKQAAQIMVQVCRGLQAVHAKGIIHRDLKPENLMIGPDWSNEDNVKILDFGISQLQSAGQDSKEKGMAVGSVGYMSPEQICAHPVDYRTDLYSLGIIFYEALCGHPPFRGNTRNETMALHVQERHMPPSMLVPLEKPALIDSIINRALAKPPDHRYQSAKDMEDDMNLVLQENWR